jgi:hypothetical protein
MSDSGFSSSPTRSIPVQLKSLPIDQQLCNDIGIQLPRIPKLGTCLERLRTLMQP